MLLYVGNNIAYVNTLLRKTFRIEKNHLLNLYVINVNMTCKFQKGVPVSPPPPSPPAQPSPYQFLYPCPHLYLVTSPSHISLTPPSQFSWPPSSFISNIISFCPSPCMSIANQSSLWPFPYLIVPCPVSFATSNLFTSLLLCPWVIPHLLGILIIPLILLSITLAPFPFPLRLSQ